VTRTVGVEVVVEVEDWVLQEGVLFEEVGVDVQESLGLDDEPFHWIGREKIDD
jgi:hypothetical protein